MMALKFESNPIPPEYALENMKTLYGRKGLVKELNLATGTSATTLRTAIRVPAMMSKSTYNKIAGVYGWEVWE